MADAPCLSECTTEAAGVVGVLIQQISPNHKAHDLTNEMAPKMDDGLGGSNNKKDEGYGQLQITVNQIRERLREKEADNHGSEGNPRTDSSPQEIKHDFRELEREVWYKKSGQQVGSPVSPVQDQQIAAQNNDP